MQIMQSSLLILISLISFSLSYIRFEFRLKAFNCSSIFLFSSYISFLTFFHVWLQYFIFIYLFLKLRLQFIYFLLIYFVSRFITYFVLINIFFEWFLSGYGVLCSSLLLSLVINSRQFFTLFLRISKFLFWFF